MDPNAQIPGAPTAGTPYAGTPIIGEQPTDPGQPQQPPIAQTHPPQMIEGAQAPPPQPQPAAQQPMAPGTQGATPATTIHPLDDLARIDAFKRSVMQLNYECEQIFKLPLDAMLTMVYRHAVNTEQTGIGRMRIFEGMSQFVPDYPTLNMWFDAYLAEVQHQKKVARANAAGGAEMV